jgi:hypothetical protein
MRIAYALLPFTSIKPSIGPAANRHYTALTACIASVGVGGKPMAAVQFLPLLLHFLGILALRL